MDSNALIPIIMIVTDIWQLHNRITQYEKKMYVFEMRGF